MLRTNGYGTDFWFNSIVLRPGRCDGGNFNTSKHLHRFPDSLHPGRPDEHGMDRCTRFAGRRQRGEVQLGFKGINLPAERVAAYGDVQPAEGLLGVAGHVPGGIGNLVGKQNHACTAAIDRQPGLDPFLQGITKSKDAGQLVDRGGFPTGQDQPVDAGQLCGAAHTDGTGSAGFDGAGVFAHVAL